MRVVIEEIISSISKLVNVKLILILRIVKGVKFFVIVGCFFVCFIRGLMLWFM